jgi:U3 small nucleolar RNA-associated protein 10
MPVLLSSQFCFFKCQLAGWAKKILIIVNTKYPSELRGAVHQFLQVCSRILCFSLLAIIVRISESLDGLNFELVQLQQHNKAQSKKDDSLYKILCKMLDGNLDSSSDISESKLWFALYHPKVPPIYFH